METIYKIIGGGQKVKQNLEFGIQTEYIKEESDWPEKLSVLVRIITQM